MVVVYFSIICYFTPWVRHIRFSLCYEYNNILRVLYKKLESMKEYDKWTSRYIVHRYINIHTMNELFSLRKDELFFFIVNFPFSHLKKNRIHILQWIFFNERIYFFIRVFESNVVCCWMLFVCWTLCDTLCHGCSVVEK